MPVDFEQLVLQNDFTRQDIERLLSATGEKQNILFQQSANIRKKHVGNSVYLRGLIELSNICRKDCLYCGIRKSNTNIERYRLTEQDVLQATKFAFNNHFGSIVLQAGELCSIENTQQITNLIKQIKHLSNGKLGITLSLGEQTEDVHREWFEAGAHRYLLRIETSNAGLYRKIHPDNNLHSFEKRLGCLKSLQKTGYQTGSGVMIGLPHQTITDLANDILFLKQQNIDMVGMGPYLEHNDTPLYAEKDILLPPNERYWLALRMIAVLRLVMPDINIAATTALQAIYPDGRIKAIEAGANVIMPNITPLSYRNNYNLYENKPTDKDSIADSVNILRHQIQLAGYNIGLNKWGDSLHYNKRMERNDF